MFDEPHNNIFAIDINNPFPQIAGIVTRVAYRALLRREPETGVSYADESSPLAASQEAYLEDILRNMARSPEFRSLEPEVQEFGPDTWVLASIYDDLKMWLDLGDLGVSRPAMRKNYEPVETAFIDSILRPGLHFADIGGNIGWFALRAARAVGPTGKVIAFEPRRETSRHLKMSAEANGFQDWMTVHAVAVGAEEGDMYIGYSADGINAGGTWSLPTADLVDSFRRNGQIVQPTPVKRFDDVIGTTRIDIIKIDIEGAEMLALRGAAGVIARDKPTILAEINPGALAQVSQSSGEEIVDLVRSFGYDGFYLTQAGVGAKIAASVELPDGQDMINVVFRPLA